MKITTELYQLSQAVLPTEGQHIIGHQTEDQIVVYQAYKPSIAKFAVANQALGGNEFSYNRMSWIKPNFLWMMFRCGWAEKENQERVLALWMNKKDLLHILSEAVISTFSTSAYSNIDKWRADLKTKEVRLQWDPDHDPYGNKITRRAIQLGLRGKQLEDFGKHKITLIEDITDFVKEQKLRVDKQQLDQLVIPVERVWTLQDNTITTTTIKI